jgi:serine/threonine protein kinase
MTFCGTLPWTAPEVTMCVYAHIHDVRATQVFQGGGYTASADVYSLGVVLWELNARGRFAPYEGMTTPAVIVGVTRGSLRPGPIRCECACEVGG